MPNLSEAVRCTRHPGAAMLLAVAILLSGCVRYEVLHYTPITLQLDGKSELHISTYPSWFPREISHAPYLYKTVRTPESVYFQVFVRAAGTRAGANPHIQSVRIRSFSYQRPGVEPVQLISDLDEGFWMQGDSAPEDRTPPAPCEPEQPITVQISLELNGENYQFEGKSRCAVRRRTGLLLAHAMAN